MQQQSFLTAPAASRRHFLATASGSLGAMALGGLLEKDARAAVAEQRTGGLPGLPHFPPTAKRVIYLFQSGGPAQHDLYDYKPNLEKLRGEDLPASVRQGQRLTVMTSRQTSFPIAPTKFKFSQHGQGGAWLSELLPHTAGMADDICFIRSMHTEAINHDPAITLILTGRQLAGRPSIGAWMSYGLGSVNEELPAFVVMVSGSGGQPLYDRLWGSGFLAAKHQGVRFRSSGDPVLYLSNPPGVGPEARRGMLDGLAQLNRHKLAQTGAPEIAARIAQYEMAFRMQTSVPELIDVSNEPEHVLKMYGPDVQQPGTYAANCLLARRLAERDVRFIQLFHRGWDQHGRLPKDLSKQCQTTDQATAALLADLKQRGLLKDTLVVWGGEFGRTVYCQGKLTREDYGRDHHPRCFTIWLAGGGIGGGKTYGETDDFSYNIVKDPVHFRDLNATILHCLGIDHARLSVRIQGLNQRLTGVEEARVLKPILG